MSAPLPAVPGYELDSKVGPMSRAIVMSGTPGENVYRLPMNFGCDDLNHPHDPPAALGAFYPQQKV